MDIINGKLDLSGKGVGPNMMTDKYLENSRDDFGQQRYPIPEKLLDPIINYMIKNNITSDTAAMNFRQSLSIALRAAIEDLEAIDKLADNNGIAKKKAVQVLKKAGPADKGKMNEDLATGSHSEAELYDEYNHDQDPYGLDQGEDHASLEKSGYRIMDSLADADRGYMSDDMTGMPNQGGQESEERSESKGTPRTKYEKKRASLQHQMRKNDNDERREMLSDSTMKNIIGICSAYPGRD